MSEDIDKLNRKARRAAAKTEGAVDTTTFLKIADKFIDVANKENKQFKASEVHMAFLYAAARYNAHVAKNVYDVDNHEEFVKEMAGQYKEMLRQHLADDSLEHKKATPEDFISGSGGDEN
ncbi:MAG: DUF3144 domain-containing protein [Alphaproteobacteria bacterium]|nr:DUF3144 domain-containing protein [Alphaproteobacteria bacterium]